MVVRKNRLLAPGFDERSPYISDEGDTLQLRPAAAHGPPPKFLCSSSAVGPRETHLVRFGGVVAGQEQNDPARILVVSFVIITSIIRIAHQPGQGDAA